MKLKPLSPAATTPSTGSTLQRQAADRITARWEETQRKKRRAETVGKVRSLTVSLVLLGVLGGVGFLVWWSGLLDHGFKGAKTAILQKIESMITQKKEQNRLLAAYSEFSESFKSVKIDYWRNAPESDRPGKHDSPLVFRCLVPGENGEPVFLELRTAPNAPMQIWRISANLEAAELSKQDFSKITEATPYLVARESRAYLSTPKKRAKADAYPVPSGIEGFNPSKVEFGELYGLIAKMKIPLPDFRYDVQFVSKDIGKAVEIATVGYGEGITREQIKQKLTVLFPKDDSRVEALLNGGCLRFDSVCQMRN